MAAMLRFTTSIPTPRPETSVTTSAVENPGAKIRLNTSPSLILSLTGKPLDFALANILSRFKPPPSSVTSITMLPPLCAAESVNVPASDLPAALRPAGISMP